jgi:hypothetical protein
MNLRRDKHTDMIPFKNFLLLLPIFLSSVEPKSSKVPDNGAVRISKSLAARVVLDYNGSVTGAESMWMRIEVTIDTLVGVRYEVKLTRGGSVFSHVALFYKFSNPQQAIFYNFITHKSTVSKDKGSPDSDANVDVVGKETVSAYACTHLQHGAGTNEITDYWMSQQRHGFLELTNSLKTISAGLPAMAFNGTIFHWGGLVKMKIIDTDPKTGKTLNMDLHLANARINIPLPLNTFEVPSK